MIGCSSKSIPVRPVTIVVFGCDMCPFIDRTCVNCLIASYASSSVCLSAVIYGISDGANSGGAKISIPKCLLPVYLTIAIIERSLNRKGAFAVTGRTPCQCQVAFLHIMASSTVF